MSAQPVDNVSQSQTNIPARKQEEPFPGDSEESTFAHLIEALRVEEFLDRFQQLSWDVASTDREENATPEQRENVTRMTDIFLFWITINLEETIEEAGLKGNLIGGALYGLAPEKDINLRALSEWFDLIEEDTYNTGDGWAELFRDEASEEDLEFNKMLDEGLCLMRDKERVFLVSLLYTLEGVEDYENSESGASGESDGTTKELDQDWNCDVVEMRRSGKIEPADVEESLEGSG